MHVAQQQIDCAACDEQQEHRFAQHLERNISQASIQGRREFIRTFEPKARCRIRMAEAIAISLSEIQNTDCLAGR